MYFSPLAHTSFDPAFARRFGFAAPAGAAQDRSIAITQTEAGYELTLDLPGLAKTDVGVEIEGDSVRITSVPDAQRKVKLAYRLPTELDAATSSAKLENGVLTLSLARLEPVSRAHSLAVS